ncbi:MAG: KOW domain-containing RNA-binding protein [Firmicutes bacterium]|nr:KOW domain-containing RNA-binding protein [Bacillota bacterium]
MSEIMPGQVVISRAGRDHGRAYVVVRMAEPPYVWVADGGLRRLARPKKKNVRHLQATRYVALPLATRLRAGQPVSDEDLRAALRRWEAERQRQKASDGAGTAGASAGGAAATGMEAGEAPWAGQREGR